MPVSVRLAASADAASWIRLARGALGENPPLPCVFDASWVEGQLGGRSGHETWVAETGDGVVRATISLLRPAPGNTNPVISLGRHFCEPEAYGGGGAAAALLARVVQVGRGRQQMLVARVLTSDTAQQTLYEEHGFVCAGYQPAKHVIGEPRDVLFYVLAANPVLVGRLPLSDSLSQVSDLAKAVLESLRVSPAMAVRDGVTGYPLHADLEIREAVFDEYEWWRLQSQLANPVREISSGFKRGAGWLRIDSEQKVQATLGERDGQIVAGLAWFQDGQDRCLRIVDAFATDYFSIGPILTHTIASVESRERPVYLEVDVLANARRLLKCAEQLGLVPVAYLPAFCYCQGHFSDVVKMVKMYESRPAPEARLTAQARSISELVHQSFQDLEIGRGIIEMLRANPMLRGLGDGELRKIVRLCMEKPCQAGEWIFRRGDAGNEAYIVQRGQVDIFLDEQAEPVATLQAGQIFGELAFLDGAPRVASAAARQATTLLVLPHRPFTDLVQSEPHIGLVVLRNTARDLASKLRHTSHLLVERR